jgi:DNA polymerase-1
MGDASDNVPGVKGIGEKTAKALMEKYGSLETLYEHLDDLKGKQRENLEAERDMAFFSRQLVTIETKVPLDVCPDHCLRRDFDREKAAAIFTELEFQTLLQEFLPEPQVVEETDYRLVLTMKELEAVIKEMKAAGRFSLDTETNSVDPMRASLVGISMSARQGTGYYIPVGHAPEAMVRATDRTDDLFAGQPVEGLTLHAALEKLRPLLEDPKYGKVGQNIKYDVIVFARHGLRVAGIQLDTMVASYLTDPSRLRHNLDEICLHYLKRKTIPISDLIGKGIKSVTFDKVPIDSACEYACEDADVTGRLAEVFEPLLREKGLERLFREVELPLIDVLARMEMAGVAIDPEVFESLKGELVQRLKALEAEIYERAGERFQINSPKQLQDILFNKLKLKPVRKTKTGFSTDVDVLEELALEHPLPGVILEYRGLEKLRSTYVEALPKLVHPETGRIHTSFNQAVAATGRLSSSDPNLQNIPIRTDIGKRIRAGFVPGGKDRKLISADYSQIELRILAHLSGDRHLREAFQQDSDVHRATAVRVFGVAPEAVTPEMRRQAKGVNFGVIYGMSAFGLAKELKISRADAARFIEEYFKQYPGVNEWINDTLRQAKDEGYVTTLLKRRRYVADLKSRDMAVRRGAERIAVNTPVQGSAADIIKLAMIRLDKALQDTDARLVLQVHDELLIEGPASSAAEVAETTRQIMENAVKLDVPLKVDVGVGDNWAVIH